MPESVYRVTSMPKDAPREPGAEGASRASAKGRVERMLDRVLEVQRPVVLAHLRSIRRGAPDASPADLIRMLERRYLAAVTTGGAAVGATAVVPGIGTAATLAISGVETAGFLEATALFGQSVAEVHGIAVTDPDRARALVTTLLLGQEGVDLVRQFAAQSAGAAGVPGAKAAGKSAYWGELVTSTLPRAISGTVADRLTHAFVKRFAAAGGAGWIGKALPFGVGAVIGGAGNNILGRRVLATARDAFGPAPLVVPDAIEPGDASSFAERAGRMTVRAARATAGAAGAAVGRAARTVRSVGGTRRAVDEAPAEPS